MTKYTIYDTDCAEYFGGEETIYDTKQDAHDAIATAFWYDQDADIDPRTPDKIPLEELLLLTHLELREVETN